MQQTHCAKRSLCAKAIVQRTVCKCTTNDYVTVTFSDHATVEENFVQQTTAQLWSTTVLRNCAPQLCFTNVLHNCGPQLCSTIVLHNCAPQLCSTTVLQKSFSQLPSLLPLLPSLPLRFPLILPKLCLPTITCSSASSEGWYGEKLGIFSVPGIQVKI